MSNPNQLFLLADHIKLSLLERQRAISLDLEPNSQDGHISRSLDSFRAGLDAITQEIERLESSGDEAYLFPPLRFSDSNTSNRAAVALRQTEQSLQSQYDDLTSQFHGFPTGTTNPPVSSPALTQDLSRASDPSPASSLLKKSLRGVPSSKSVRFTDSHNLSISLDEEEAARAQLFPYRDDPTTDGPPDHRDLDNVQIHAYHTRILAEQDEQLDRLGESIGRQRELSIQIGDELDSQVAMLEEVDGIVDRHGSRLEQARRSLGRVARRAGENAQITTIVVLIVVLVLLIIILK